MTTTTVAIGTMKVAPVFKPGADFQIVAREIPEPRSGRVRIEVQACGVCRRDSFAEEAFHPVRVPHAPGHEVAGIVDEVGAGVFG